MYSRHELPAFPYTNAVKHNCPSQNEGQLKQDQFSARMESIQQSYLLVAHPEPLCAHSVRELERTHNHR